MKKNLYHITTVDCVDDILSTGLIPGKRKHSLFRRSTQNDWVFLTPFPTNLIRTIGRYDLKQKMSILSVDCDGLEIFDYRAMVSKLHTGKSKIGFSEFVVKFVEPKRIRQIGPRAASQI